MYKVGFIGRYKPGIGKDEGRAHWEGIHADLTAATPGLRKFVLNLSTQNLGELGPNDEPVRYDGYAWLWFHDREAFDAATESDEWTAAAEDAGEFLVLKRGAMAASVE